MAAYVIAGLVPAICDADQPTAQRILTSGKLPLPAFHADLSHSVGEVYWAAPAMTVLPLVADYARSAALG